MLKLKTKLLLGLLFLLIVVPSPTHAQAPVQVTSCSQCTSSQTCIPNAGSGIYFCVYNTCVQGCTGAQGCRINNRGTINQTPVCVSKCEIVTCPSGTVCEMNGAAPICKTPSGTVTPPEGVPSDVTDIVGTVEPPFPIDSSSNAVQNFIPSAYNISFFVGIVASIGYFLYGGIRWIMGGGDPKALAAARETITHAIIGLILLAIAFAIATIIGVITGTAKIPGSNQTTPQTDYVDLRICGSNLPGSSPDQQFKCEEAFSGGKISRDLYNSLPQSKKSTLCVGVGACAAGCEYNNRVGKYVKCLPY